MGRDFQLFTEDQIESLRFGGQVLGACLQMCKEQVKPGITTRELDSLAEEFITSHPGATPAFKGYQGFPATLCTSVNDGCVHGIPSDRVLEEGDIVSVDCGVLYDELNTDACLTVPVGAISSEAQELLEITKRALEIALEVISEGVQVGDISAAVQEHVEAHGHTIVRPLTGHGLGTTLHQFPEVPNFGSSETGPYLPSGTILAIEPIVSQVSKDIRQDSDGWTLATKKGDLSAHFEHTVLVQEGGCEVLTDVQRS